MTSAAPPLSVMLPVRNAAATVERAVRSILTSTYGDFELVVVDDGSTDTTVEILQEVARTDARVRVLLSERADFIATLNLAVSACRASRIARMDADDISAPQRLELQMAYLDQHGEIDGVGGRVRIVDNDGRAVASWQRYEAWINDSLTPDAILAYRFVESPIANPTAMVRREVFDLGYRDGPWPEDYELWLRALHNGLRLAKLDAHVLDWIDSPGRVTRTHARYSPQAFDRCKREYLLNGPLRNTRLVDLWGAGETGKPWFRWLREQGVSVRRLIEIDPRKVGQRLDGIRMVPPAEITQADGIPLVVAVGAAGARSSILRHVEPLGFRAGRETWFVA